MIEVKNIVFNYERQNQNVLDNVSFSIPQGSWVSIIGHNGCGKSTLAKILMGLLFAQNGEVIINKETLTSKSAQAIRKNMGIIFQNPDDQFVGATVRYDLAFGLENNNVSRDQMIKIIDKISQELQITSILDKSPQELSGGQKQKVALAGLLALNKNIFIFDEALSMLDQKASLQIFKLIKELHRQGKTIIYITHDLGKAFVADKIILLKNGKLIFEGSPNELYDNVKLLTNSNLDLPKPLLILKQLSSENINEEKFAKVKEILWNFLLQK